MPKAPEKRCDWSFINDMMQEYHDTEWGVPIHDDTKLFEFLVLEGMQAGLSWNIILHKRKAFREAFDGFEISKVSNYNYTTIEKLIQNKEIVRNRKKIEAAVNNAKKVEDIQREFGSFNKYLWSFVGNRPVTTSYKTIGEVPCFNDLSDRISSDLIKRGFIFVGTKIIYSMLQAVGLINDHITSCFRHSRNQQS